MFRIGQSEIGIIIYNYSMRFLLSKCWYMQIQDGDSEIHEEILFYINCWVSGTILFVHLLVYLYFLHLKMFIHVTKQNTEEPIQSDTLGGTNAGLQNNAIIQ